MKTSELHTFKSILNEGIRIEGQEKPIEISCIYIPKIQRAYAQGRNNESDIRKDFLDALFNVITSKDDKSSMELSFLFGSKQLVVKRSSEGFELLDGQQRTTTLFLLYWYISMKENKCVPDFLSRFTYETRDTSTHFLANITSADSKIDISNQKPSDAIKHKKWFTDDFYCDSTVSAMLTMLDSIDKHYKKHGCTKIFDNLDRLRFYVLMLDKFDMNDELYIKMNSRGLSLIPFENFKASLVQFMKAKKCLYGDENVSKSGEVPFWFSFTANMDASWIDLFWHPRKADADEEYTLIEDLKKTDKLIGDEYFNFINRFLFTQVALHDTLSKKLNDLTSFFYNDAESPKMKQRLYGWDMYEKALSLNSESAEESLSLDKTVLYRLSKVLNVFHNNIDLIKELIGTDPYGNTHNFEPASENFNLHHRVAFGAVTEFINNIPNGKSITDEEIIANFKRMLRVLFNIIENTLIESPEAAIRVIKIFHELCSADGAVTDNFYKSLATGTFTSKNTQLAEEIIKAKEMFTVGDKPEFIPNWDTVFKKAEKHDFFKGSILFFFTEKAGSSDDFEKRFEKVKGLFDSKGISEDYRRNHILIRAILSSLTTWSLFGNQYVTEDAEHEKYLKNIIIGNASVRQLFCSYFDDELNNEMSFEEYFNKAISVATPAETENEGFKMLFSRLVTDEKSVYIFDWLHKIERHRKGNKRFYIQVNRDSYVINIPGTWYDRMLFDTERNQIIPLLAEKYEMEYCNADQKGMITGPIKDCWGWDIAIQKKLNTPIGKIIVQLIFNEWKWVDFNVYSDNIDIMANALSEGISGGMSYPITADRKKGDHIKVTSVPYKFVTDMKNIEDTFDNISQILNGLSNDSDINE